MNAPNMISLARLLSVPVFVWCLLSGRNEAAFWLFAAAGASDAVDGYLAKHHGMASRLGAYLDPIADKVLLVSAYIVLGSMDIIPLWLTILVVSRDLLIVGGAILFETVTGELQMEPLLISKVNTGMQIILVGTAMAQPMFALPLAGIVSLLCLATGFLTVVSGAFYIVIWFERASMIENGAMTKNDKDIK